MIISDVIGELKKRGIYLVYNPTPRKNTATLNGVSDTVITTAILVDAIFRATESGDMWLLDKGNLIRKLRLARSWQLASILQYLCEEKLLDSTAHGTKYEYTPVLLNRELMPEKIIISAVSATMVKDKPRLTAAGSLMRILQSPRSPVTEEDLPEGVHTSLIDTNYALISYDYDAFLQEKKDLRLIAYIAPSRAANKLKATWLCINQVQKLPIKGSLGSPDFWEIFTEEYFLSDSLTANTEVNNLWNRAESVAKKSVDLDWMSVPEEFFQRTFPEITRSRIYERLLAAFKDRCHKIINDRKPSIPEFTPPKGNPLELPEKGGICADSPENIRKIVHDFCGPKENTSTVKPAHTDTGLETSRNTNEEADIKAARERRLQWMAENKQRQEAIGDALKEAAAVTQEVALPIKSVNSGRETAGIPKEYSYSDQKVTFSTVLEDITEIINSPINSRLKRIILMKLLR